MVMTMVSSDQIPPSRDAERAEVHLKASSMARPRASSLRRANCGCRARCCWTSCGLGAVLPAFLFEDGPLDGALRGTRARDNPVAVWRRTFQVRRDRSLWSAAPLAGKLAAIAAEIGLAARSYDVVYANSQKAFVLVAFATAVVRRPLIWHRHDHRRHPFRRHAMRLQIASANHLTMRVVVPSHAAAVALSPPAAGATSFKSTQRSGSGSCG